MRTGLVWLGAALGGCAFDAAGLAGATGDDSGGDAEVTPGMVDAGFDSPEGDGDVDVPRADAAPADADVPGETRVSCPRATPTLDGRLLEWPAPTVSFAMDDVAERIEVTGGYADSVKVEFHCAHDDQYIYVGYQAVDDDVSATTSDALYDDDSVTLFLDARGDATGPFGNDDHEIYFRPSVTANVKDYGPAGAQLLIVGTIWPERSGYVVEVGLAKSTLGMGGAPLPRTLGFNLGVADEDRAFLSDDFAYGIWYRADRPTCASCCADWGVTRPWCDTTTFALLRLED
jgi:hypothetical protein